VARARKLPCRPRSLPGTILGLVAGRCTAIEITPTHAYWSFLRWRSPFGVNATGVASDHAGFSRCPRPHHVSGRNACDESSSSSLSRQAFPHVASHTAARTKRESERFVTRAATRVRRQTCPQQILTRQYPCEWTHNRNQGPTLQTFQAPSPAAKPRQASNQTIRGWIQRLQNPAVRQFLPKGASAP
jgi:hypothetical protein